MADDYRIDEISQDIREIKDIVTSDHDTLQRLDQLLCGNGDIGLARRHDRLAKAVSKLEVRMAKAAALIGLSVSTLGTVATAIILKFFGL